MIAALQPGKMQGLAAHRALGGNQEHFAKPAAINH